MGWRPQWPMGQGSHGSWAKSSMGHLGHGSLWVTHSLLCLVSYFVLYKSGPFCAWCGDAEVGLANAVEIYRESLSSASVLLRNHQREVILTCELSALEVMTICREQPPVVNYSSSFFHYSSTRNFVCYHNIMPVARHSRRSLLECITTSVSTGSGASDERKRLVVKTATENARSKTADDPRIQRRSCVRHEREVVARWIGFPPTKSAFLRDSRASLRKSRRWLEVEINDNPKKKVSSAR